MGAACLGARPGWVRSRGWVLPPAPASRLPPLGGAPLCSPPFSLPRRPAKWQTSYPFSPPAGGQPTLRRAGLLSIASPCQGSGQVTPLGVTLDRARSQLAIIAAPAWVGVVPLGVFLLFVSSASFQLAAGRWWLVARSGGRRVGCALCEGDRLVGSFGGGPCRVWSVLSWGAASCVVVSGGCRVSLFVPLRGPFSGWALRRRARPPPLWGQSIPGQHIRQGIQHGYRLTVMPHQPPYRLNAARLAILGHCIPLAPAMSAHGLPETHRAHRLPQIQPKSVIGAMAQRCHALKHPSAARHIPQGLPQATRQVHLPPLTCLGLLNADPLPLKLPSLQRQHVPDAQPRMPRHPQRQPVSRRPERRLYRLQRLIRHPICYTSHIIHLDTIDSADPFAFPPSRPPQGGAPLR